MSTNKRKTENNIHHVPALHHQEWVAVFSKMYWVTELSFLLLPVVSLLCSTVDCMLHILSSFTDYEIATDQSYATLSALWF